MYELKKQSFFVYYREKSDFFDINDKKWSLNSADLQVNTFSYKKRKSEKFGYYKGKFRKKYDKSEIISVVFENVS